MSVKNINNLICIRFFDSSAEVWNRLKSCSVLDSIPESRFFPTLQDAFAKLSPTASTTDVVAFEVHANAKSR